MKRPPSPRPTKAPARHKVPDIREVARRAEVSISTVSRFLNHKPVRPDAEARIFAAVRELAYSPNRIARSLKSRRTNTIGMVIPDITNPIFPEVVKGVEVAARAVGFNLVLANMGEDRDEEWDRLQTLRAMRCDGCLLIVGPDGADEVVRRQRLEEYGLPLVFVDRRPGFPADLVVSDNDHAAAEAVRHLIRLGHRRIAVLSVDLAVSTHRERVAAYRRALREGGLEPNPAYEAHAASSVADGFSATMSLLAQNPAPTALFVTSNRLTIGAVSAIANRGLRCPEDVSVVAFDDYDWQDAFRPRLTTVAQPAYTIGHRAAQLLIARITGDKTGPPEEIVLHSQLVVRESCGIYRTGPAHHLGER